MALEDLHPSGAEAVAPKDLKSQSQFRPITGPHHEAELGSNSDAKLVRAQDHSAAWRL